LPSERARAAVGHIRDNIRLAQSFCEGLSYEAFAADPRSTYAVTRCLEIISEASRRLTAEQRGRYAHLPWRDIRDAGNVYRHEYEGVRPDVLWRTVHNHLPSLLAAVEAELARDAG
jgi:uncharacterized protein with HEPN domain